MQRVPQVNLLSSLTLICCVCFIPHEHIWKTETRKATDPAMNSFFSGKSKRGGDKGNLEQSVIGVLEDKGKADEAENG